MATITINRPNFLASEEGRVCKTAGVDAVTHTALLATETDADGLAHSILKAGTVIVAGNVKGILYQDVDVTGTTATTQKAAPVMVAGYYILAGLNKVYGTAGSETAFPTGTGAFTAAAAAAQGLIELPSEDYQGSTVTRPYN